jgi:DNA polymerase I
MRASLLDADAVGHEGKSVIRLFCKDAQSGRAFPLYARFEPYFYLFPDAKDAGEPGSEKLEEFKKTLLERKFFFRGREAGITKVGEAKKAFGFGAKELLKITVDHPGNVRAISGELRRFGEVYENNIPFHLRFLIDSGLVPGGEFEYNAGGEGFATEFSDCKDGSAAAPRVLALDIEAYSQSGAVPDSSRDPLIMASCAWDGNAEVLTYKHKINAGYVANLADEKALVEGVSKSLDRHHVDVLCTYNGDQFDLPYLQRRADILGAKFKLGRTWRKVKAKRIGMRVKTHVPGRVHFDVFHCVTFLNTVGSIRLARLTLDAAYQELFGKRKVDLTYEQMFESWRTGRDLEKVAEYSRVDAVATLAIANYCLGLEMAFARLVGMPLFEVSRCTAGQLVEFFLMRKSFAEGALIPNKPSYAEVQARQGNPLVGAYVRTPEPGVYENIAVLDFRSLYPSIIVSHNIDPSTKNCPCCKDAEMQKEVGCHFCKKNRGLVPKSLEDVLERRFSQKRMLSQVMKAAGADSEEYRRLFSEQWALKIVANSFYGYLAYPRSRWYDHDCGEATTALARKYIKDAMAQAEAEGFRVLYGDTDSLMVQYEKGAEEDVLAFQRKVNSALPGNMELELEDFYARGLFVSKKLSGAKDGKERGAKKKYALMNREGKIKIRGFELVRRDWSGVAKSTQRMLLQTLLETGDVKAAVEMVIGVIAELKAGAVPLDDLVILTQLRKKAGSYAVMSPELSAVQKARAAGVRVPENAVVGYVIGKKGKSVSEKAVLRELAADYDADYYINNQVIPATLKLLSAFGYDEDAMKSRGKQSRLGQYFG